MKTIAFAAVQKGGNRIIVIGYYVPNATPAQAQARLIGTDALSLRVPDGKFVQEMIAGAGQRDQAQIKPGPTQSQVRSKTSIFCCTK